MGGGEEIETRQALNPLDSLKKSDLGDSCAKKITGCNPVGSSFCLGPRQGAGVGANSSDGLDLLVFGRYGQFNRAFARGSGGPVQGD
jgi:hypothetical protein